MTNYPRKTLVLLLAFCGLQQAYAADALLSDTTANSSARVAPSVLENQLVLPKSYQQHRSSLWKASALVAQTSRCARFLLADLQRDRSTLSHPIFRIQCRDHTNKNYALLVDGSTMHVLDDTRPGGSISFDDLQKEIDAEHERRRIVEEKYAAEQLAEAKKRGDLQLLRQLEELKRVEDERRRQLWDHCQQQLRLKVRNMNELVWLTQDMPEPEVADDRLIYHIDFDAQDLRQQQLHYRAECVTSSAEDFRLLIRPRKNFDL